MDDGRVVVGGRVELGGRGSGVVDGVGHDDAAGAGAGAAASVDRAGCHDAARGGGRRRVQRALWVGRVALGEGDGSREVLGAGAVRGDGRGLVVGSGDASGEDDDVGEAHCGWLGGGWNADCVVVS